MMTSPTDWSDKRLLDLLDQLCANAKVNHKVQSREDMDDVRSDVLRKLLSVSGPSLGKPLAVWENYLRRAFDSALADVHRRHLSADKRDAAKEISESAFGTEVLSDSAVGFQEVLVAQDTSPTKRAVKNEEVIRLEEAVERLPQDQRRVIRDYLAGKGPTQIAAEIGATPDSVSSLLFRATLSLKSAMNQHTGQG
jgi:RNA polymerase sigma factor (sigma-70 family)